jgi:hypothetical protein
MGAVLMSPKFISGTILACLFGGAVGAAAQLLTTHAGLGVISGGGGGGGTAIAFDSSADLGDNAGLASSLTTSYTVGSGSNRLLVVFILGDLATGVDDITGVTYNGVALTLVIKQTSFITPNNRLAYMYYLLSPASGAHNIVISSSATHYLLAVAASYANVAALDASGATDVAWNSGAGSVSKTTNIAVNTANDWAVVAQMNSLGQPTNVGTSSNMTDRVHGVAFGEPRGFDSSGGLSIGTFGAQITFPAQAGGTSSDAVILGATFSP